MRPKPENLIYVDKKFIIPLRIVLVLTSSYFFLQLYNMIDTEVYIDRHGNLYSLKENALYFLGQALIYIVLGVMFNLIAFLQLKVKKG